MTALLGQARVWLIAAAVLLVVAVGGYVAWLRHDRDTERARAEAAIVAQGRLQATVDQLVATNIANVDAWARERADRTRADAAALRADEAAQAAASRLDVLKREIRRANPTSPPAGLGIRAALDGLRRAAPAGGGDAGPAGPAPDPARPAAVP